MRTLPGKPNKNAQTVLQTTATAISCTGRDEQKRSGLPNVPADQKLGKKARRIQIFESLWLLRKRRVEREFLQKKMEGRV